MYTSLSSSPEKNKISQIEDFLSKRDFIFLVVILAFLGHMDWFLCASAVGTPVFGGAVGLMAWDKIKTGRGMKAEEERREK